MYLQYQMWKSVLIFNILCDKYCVIYLSNKNSKADILHTKLQNSILNIVEVTSDGVTNVQN